MRMYNALLLLFRVANALGVLLLGISYILTIIAKVKERRIPEYSSPIAYFSNLFTLSKHCFWSGTLFIFLDWLLCSSATIIVNDVVFGELSQDLLLFGFVWALMFFVGLVVEMVLRSISPSSRSKSYFVAEGVKSGVFYSVLYFILSFLVA